MHRFGENDTVLISKHFADFVGLKGSVAKQHQAPAFWKTSILENVIVS
jgi:hypothetical protein